MTARCAGRGSSSPGARTAATSCARKLARGGGDDVAAEVIDDLARMGYVDDERYAAALAEHRLARGWGPLRIEHDLLAAGVPEAVVERRRRRARPRRRREAARCARSATAPAPPPPAAWAARGFDEDVAERLLGRPDGS